MSFTMSKKIDYPQLEQTTACLSNMPKAILCIFVSLIFLAHLLSMATDWRDVKNISNMVLPVSNLSCYVGLAMRFHTMQTTKYLIG
jgi:hypothetical protein